MYNMNACFTNTVKPALKTAVYKNHLLIKTTFYRSPGIYIFNVIEPAYKGHLCIRTTFYWSLRSSLYMEVSLYMRDASWLISCVSIKQKAIILRCTKHGSATVHVSYQISNTWLPVLVSNLVHTEGCFIDDQVSRNILTMKWEYLSIIFSRLVCW